MIMDGSDGSLAGADFVSHEQADKSPFVADE